MTRTTVGRCGAAVACVALLLAAGCGGSSSAGGGGGGGTTNPPRAVPGSARFHVDVASGHVTVEALASAASRKAGRAVLLGDAVRFASSDLLDLPGNTGIHLLRVSLTNLWPQTIGVMPNGSETPIKVLLSAFENSFQFSDLRPKVAVSTIAGKAGAAEGDGPATSVGLGSLFGTAVAADGTIFVTELGRNRIRQLRAGFLSTLAGRTTAGGDDGVGTGAAFNQPCGIAVNPVDGALIVTELSGQRVRRITRDGVATRIAGAAVDEAGDTNGNGNAARFRSPAGVVVDRDGTIYVAENQGHRIRKIVKTGADPTLPASYTVSTLAGSGVAGFADRVGTAAQFNKPTSLAIDDASHLFVGDRNNGRVRLVTADGSVSTIASGLPAFSTVDPNTHTISTGPPLPFVPAGLAWNQGGLALATGNQVVQLRLRAAGAAIGSESSWVAQAFAGRGTTVAAGGTVLDGDGFLSTFAGTIFMASEPNGGLVVVDSTLLRRVTPTSGLFPVGTPGTSTNTASVRLANADGLIPSSVFGKNLPFVSYAGKIEPGASSAARDWQFILPEGVSAFEFMVTVEANTPALTTPEAVTAGTAVRGSPSVRVRTLAGAEPGDLDGPAASARFATLRHVAVDASGVIYLADPTGRVRRLGLDGLVTTIAGRTNTTTAANGTGDVATFRQPHGIATTPDGTTLYVADLLAHSVRRLVRGTGDPAQARTWTVSTVAGTGTAGATDGAGNVATLNQPFGLALDGGGNLFVVEISGHRVRIVRFVAGDPASPTAWRVDLVAGDSSQAAGQSAVLDGLGSTARFALPEGIAVTPDGTLWVTDVTRLRRITTPTAAGGGTVTTPVGAGTGYQDSTDPSQVRFGGLSGITIDSGGYLYVSDKVKHAIRRISPDLAVTTVAGTGVADPIDGTGATAGFDQPFGIAVDPSGNLVVADFSSVRLVQRTLGAGSP